ncbi:Uncharacterised protein [Shigella sonnei]|nr:Uncharacterised protein [Shigella sonnei]
MSNHQEGGALQAIQFPKQLEDAVGVTRIEVTGRLIRKYQTRIIDQRTGNRHTLAFAARKFRWAVIRTMLQPHRF